MNVLEVVEKGAKLWMNTEKEKTWLQCTNCGRIHIVERYISMEKSVVNSYCERCGNTRALNCGYSEDDVVELQDYFLDLRYYY
jgi:transcription elongation factor Elf1